MIGLEDNDDKAIELLQQIRDEVSGGVTSPGSTTNTTNTTVNRTVNVEEAPKRINKPHNSVNITNQVWEDDRISTVEISGALDPGDTETVARMESTETGVALAASAVAATEHVADLDGDTDDESVVEYYWEYRSQNGGDAWNPLPGLSSTLPLGYLGKPVEIVPGELVGPVAGFRCRVHNRSDDYANPTTVPQEELGGQIAGIVLREVDG